MVIVCDRITKPSQIQLFPNRNSLRSHYQTIPKFNSFRNWNSLRSHYQPYQILTIVESQQFAIAPFKPSLKNLLTYSHPCTVLWKN
ncbi:MAG: hypothetical protein HC903_21865 [Methylacidiphilales bacterium]|nr:hypothetical protein [Candidatus Methylacidiphilales bacterium]